MFDFWVDTSSLVTVYRGAYRFKTVPKFWDYLLLKAEEKIVLSSFMVLKELEDGCSGKQPDELLTWSRQCKEKFFLFPTENVQKINTQIVDTVSQNPQYAKEEIQEFLKGADPWIIAHAKVLGGKVVTFEISSPNSKKVKIPDVADKFGVTCIDLYDMLTELNAQL